MSSRKQVTPEKQVFTSFDMSTAGTSEEIYCELLDRILFSLDWIGTPQGNISVQVSNTGKLGSWKTIPISDSLDLVGAADTAFIQIKEVAWKYIRLSYSFTAGTGTLNAYYKAHSEGS